MNDVHLITKEIEFDAGHRVPHHNGKCRFPHGHRYKVTAFVTGIVDNDHEAAGSQTGMVTDFSILKEVMVKEIHDVLDHKFIIWDQDEPMKQALDAFIFESGADGRNWGCAVEFPYVPTAENMAQWCYDSIELPLEENDVRLLYITVYETPTSSATYRREV